MANTALTRSLFEPLIQKPPLTDQLLQRPPFKFLHDVVNETIRATGYLAELFTADDLDHTKAAADKTSKISFLEKLIDALNVDGSLNDVKASRIVAGKDAELTNVMLQKLATEAAAHKSVSSSSAKPSKHKSSKSKSKERSKSKEHSSHRSSKDSKEKDHEKEKPEKKKSSSKLKTPEPTKEKEKEKKSSKKSHHSSKDKDKPEKKRSKSKSESKRRESVDNTRYRDLPSPPIQTDPNFTTVDRESSGGTSKGGDDSGIAEETAESERHDLEAHLGSFDAQPAVSAAPEPALVPQDENELPKRPTTSAARPQTALGRPGTAAARPAPPKIKKTKVMDLDPTAVSSQSAAMDKAVVLMEETEDAKPQPGAPTADDFIVEEEDEPVLVSNAVGADINDLQHGGDHGQLVNRIIANTRKLEEDAGALNEPSAFYDLSEQKKMRAEVETVQRALQATAQSTNPLAHSLDFVVEDFDLMLREIEENRKVTAEYDQQLQNKTISQGAEVVSMTSMLRSLNGEIRDVQAQIARTTAKILENESDFKNLNANIDADFNHSERRVMLWKMCTELLIRNNLFQIIQSLVQDYRDVNPLTKTVALRSHFSIYWDVLFIALDRYKRDVDRDHFDYMFEAEFQKLPVPIQKLLDTPDRAPKSGTICCRRIFLPLDMH
uniref:TRAF3-interacting protein 1 n=1 Tax=Panagrellus redivivus TaxID=6233 RepID=A0A7E4ZYR6_PANRE